MSDELCDNNIIYRVSSINSTFSRSICNTKNMNFIGALCSLHCLYCCYKYYLKLNIVYVKINQPTVSKYLN